MKKLKKIATVIRHEIETLDPSDISRINALESVLLALESPEDSSEYGIAMRNLSPGSDWREVVREREAYLDDLIDSLEED